MDLDLRPVTDDELPAFHRAVATAFGSLPSSRDVDEWAGVWGHLAADRTLAAFDEERIVGTAGAFSFELTVPGGAHVPAAGVSVVGVHPTHRRQGLLVRMMDEQLDDVARRGEPVAVLTASESSIYGRFGYGLATFGAVWQLQREGTLLAKPSTAVGRTRLVDHDDAPALVQGVYDAVASTRVGEVTRPATWWAAVYRQRPDGEEPGDTAKFFTVVHEDASGTVDGFARYSVSPSWPHGRPSNRLEILELQATGPEAEAALFEFLLGVDLVGTLEAWDRPFDDALRWRLADPRRIETTRVVDHLWVRMVDVGAALSARTYSTDDTLTFELVDGFRPANGGRWCVEGGPTVATCARTDREADLLLSAPDLGALYLGGVEATTLARAGRIEERTPGAVRRADLFFGTTPLPWCTTHF